MLEYRQRLEGYYQQKGFRRADHRVRKMTDEEVLDALRGIADEQWLASPEGQEWQEEQKREAQRLKEREARREARCEIWRKQREQDSVIKPKEKGWWRRLFRRD
jgi:hypothetical protein